MSGNLFDDDPIIVLGMHRSGTTLLSRMLREFAGHMGADLCSSTSESIVFQRMNIKLLFDCNASWHTPEPIWSVLENDRRVKELGTRLGSQLSGRSAALFWGKQRSRSQSARFWGWKDPRNTLTLPIWFRVFPNAKMIYIVRNGVDVAWSLFDRDQLQSCSRIRTTARKILVHMIPQRWPEYKPSPFTLQEAFELWAEYLRFADFNTSELPDEKILRLRYEDLLQDPLPSLQRIADFVAAETTNQTLMRLARRLNADRRFAFVNNAKACEFYSLHREHPAMVRHGYDQISAQDVSAISCEDYGRA